MQTTAYKEHIQHGLKKVKPLLNFQISNWRNFFDSSSFLYFIFFSITISFTLIEFTHVAVSQLRAQELSMSQNRWQTEYLIITDDMLPLLLHTKLMQKNDLVVGFSKRFNYNPAKWLTVLHHRVPCRTDIRGHWKTLAFKLLQYIRVRPIIIGRPLCTTDWTRHLGISRATTLCDTDFLRYAW